MLLTPACSGADSVATNSWSAYHSDIKAFTDSCKVHIFNLPDADWIDKRDVLWDLTVRTTKRSQTGGRNQETTDAEPNVECTRCIRVKAKNEDLYLSRADARTSAARLIP